MHIDNAVLRWFLIIQEPSGHLVRWPFHMAKYSFQARHKKGPHNVYIDALSWLRTNAETTSGDWDKIRSILIQTPWKFSTNLPPKQRFKRVQNQHVQQNHSGSRRWLQLWWFDPWRAVRNDLETYPFRLHLQANFDLRTDHRTVLRHSMRGNPLSF